MGEVNVFDRSAVQGWKLTVRNMTSHDARFKWVSVSKARWATGVPEAAHDLRLRHPAIDFWVDIHLRKYGDVWLAVADLAGELERCRRIAPAQDLQIFPFERYCGERKVFEFLSHAFAERAEVVDVPFAPCLDRNRHDAIVANALRLIVAGAILLDLQHTDRTAFDNQTRR